MEGCSCQELLLQRLYHRDCYGDLNARSNGTINTESPNNVAADELWRLQRTVVNGAALQTLRRMEDWLRYFSVDAATERLFTRQTTKVSDGQSQQDCSSEVCATKTNSGLADFLVLLSPKSGFDLQSASPRQERLSG